MSAIVESELIEFFIWFVFFMSIAFLRYFVVVVRERFTTLTIRQNVHVSQYTLLLVFTIILSMINITMAGAIVVTLTSSSTTTRSSISLIGLLLFEHMVILFGCIKVICKYSLHIYSLLYNPQENNDDNQQQNNNGNNNDQNVQNDNDNGAGEILIGEPLQNDNPFDHMGANAVGMGNHRTTHTSSSIILTFQVCLIGSACLPTCLFACLSHCRWRCRCWCR